MLAISKLVGVRPGNGFWVWLLVGVLCTGLALASVAVAEEDSTDAGKEAQTAADAGDGSDKSKAEPTVEERLGAVEDRLAVVSESSVIYDDKGNVKSTIYTDANVLWTCLAAFLVFFMQAGFALVESGFTRAKNACNIIMKNVMDLSIGAITFWIVGFGLMFWRHNNRVLGNDRLPFRS